MRQGVHFCGLWAMYSFGKSFLMKVNDMQEYNLKRIILRLLQNYDVI